MYRVISSGYIPAEIIKDNYQGTDFHRLLLKISNMTQKKLKLDDGCYELIDNLFKAQQAQAKKQ